MNDNVLVEFFKKKEISTEPEIFKNIDDFIDQTKSIMKDPGLGFNWGPNENFIWKFPKISNMFTSKIAADRPNDASICCDHDPIFIKKRVSGANQYTAYCMRCRLCGRPINSNNRVGGEIKNGGQWIKKSLLTERQMNIAIDTEEFFNKNQESFDRYKEFHDKMDNMVIAVLNFKWWDCYQAYLNSPEWFEKRDVILQQYFNTCGVIGCSNTAGIAHHLHYDNVGNEDYDDLIAICKPHHNLIHTTTERYFKRNIKNYTMEIFEDYFGRSI